MSGKMPGLADISGMAGDVSSLFKSGDFQQIGPTVLGGIEKLPGVFVNSAIGSIDDAISSKVNTAVGSFLNKLGIPQGRFYAKAKSRPDPLWQMDWMIQMPLGLPFEYVEEIQFPMSDFGMSNGIYRAGTRNYFAEASDIAPVTINFYEDRYLTVTKWLQKWRSLVQNPDGTFNLPIVYKKNIVLMPMDVKGNTLGSFTLSGVFPTKIPVYPFISNNSERTVLSVEFSVDNSDMTYKSGLAQKFLGGIVGEIDNLSSKLFSGGVSFLNSGSSGSSSAGSAFNSAYEYI